VHDEKVAIDECIEAGVAAFVLKKTAVNDLVAAIESVQQGITYVSPSVRMKPENGPMH
jgi:DNA-binding NarL/FixJ family response regulator